MDSKHLDSQKDLADKRSKPRISDPKLNQDIKNLGMTLESSFRSTNEQKMAESNTKQYKELLLHDEMYCNYE